MEPNNAKKRLNVTLDFRIVTLVLLVVIAGMLLVWKPWQGTISADSRTVQATGEATVSATPDELLFYPTYQFMDKDRETLVAELSAKSKEIVTRLEELGVPENKIKINSDGTETYDLRAENAAPTFTLRLTITVDNLELAQKVQDYLLTTSPTGTISPQAGFSNKKRQELEDKAREQALENAKAKAEQSAENLGFALGKVKTVTDGGGFGNIPYTGRNAADSAMTAEADKQSLDVKPGENDLTYTVTVTYFVK